MKEVLESRFEPEASEKKWYAFWESKKFFEPSLDSKAESYTIVLPPPNVTGVLHMGHALTVTLEDILIRRKRMMGFNTLWVPGTDHAGIATQMVVERHLLKNEKKTRFDLGRKKFLEKTWEWKEASQSTILSQLRKMGCSLDWSKLVFTMDPQITKAVRVAFVSLYDQGLISQKESFTQWCPRCETALSDLEVKTKEISGKLWKIKYKGEAGAPDAVVATTRPETLLGDVAVAINPNDGRYKKLHGKNVILPILNKKIPVVLDEYVDMQFGTGALKITPAHDANDYEIGKKHQLPMINIFDDKAKLNSNAGTLAGLSRELAREQILKNLKEEGLLEGETDHTHAVHFCDRCDTKLEPKLSVQWFLDAEVLAKPALEAVEKGDIKIVPKEWEKTYFEWMRNIRPWCISRQLWWGHQIPVWRCEACQFEKAYVDAPMQCPKCKSTEWKQEQDVLDTWFSSGLWPFATLGWPDKTKALEKFYPNSVMETGFDIIFFWVARMVMFGIHFMKKPPFHTVYLHPMVRDEYGQKMSKTKGNVIDPLEIVNTCGADSLRFTLASLAVHGRDVLLSDSRIQGYRNFVNKLWNASRFVLMHFGEVKQSKKDLNDRYNRWILTRLQKTTEKINQSLDEYKFYESASDIYHFIWNEFCDWYLEFIKSDIEERKKKQDSTAIEVLEKILALLHPYMPFVTEEIWQKLPIKANRESLCVVDYPKLDHELIFESEALEVSLVISVIEAIRSKRGEAKIAPSVLIPVSIQAPKKYLDLLQKGTASLKTLAKVEPIEFGKAPPPETKPIVLSVVHEQQVVEVFIPKESLVDLSEEKSKTEKELIAIRGEFDRAKAKLENEQFVSKAPPQVLQGVRDRKAELEKKINSLEQYLRSL